MTPQCDSLSCQSDVGPPPFVTSSASFSLAGVVASKGNSSSGGGRGSGICLSWDMTFFFLQQSELVGLAE